jgi:hypothetical protein
MKGFRTITFNIIAAILPALQATDLTDVLGSNGMAIYGVIMAAVNIALRMVTTTPVLKAE